MTYSDDEDLGGSRATDASMDDASRTYTVDEISHSVRSVVEGHFRFVRVQGEISGYRGPHGSGHCYFSLRGSNTKLDAIIWRTRFERLAVKPEEGKEVVAMGRLTTYPNRSNYQIIIDGLESVGVGAAVALLEELRRRLAAEGLFAEGRKRALPVMPLRIGIITSPTGAVIRDILHRLEARWPCHVLLWPVRVQGEMCAREVEGGLRGFNAIEKEHWARPDVIIVARGGGSYEELSGFNEELVVRAAAESTIPVISAVGHESDWTLLDLVADRRAPTPTAAAEIVTPVKSDLLDSVDELCRRHRSSVSRSLMSWNRDVDYATHRLTRLESLLDLPRQRLDMTMMRIAGFLRKSLHGYSLSLSQFPEQSVFSFLPRRIEFDRRTLGVLLLRARRAVEHIADSGAQRVEAVHKICESMGYRNVLARGYALVYEAGGGMVRSVKSVAPGTVLRIHFADGSVLVTVRPESCSTGDTGGQGENPEEDGSAGCLQRALF